MKLQRLTVERASGQDDVLAVTGFGAPGRLAYHPIPEAGKGSWGVTHLPSGGRIHGRFLTRAQARALCVAVLESGIPWEKPADELDLREAYTVVQGAMAALGVR